MKKLEELLKYQKEIYDLEYTINLLNWDLKIDSPKQASDDLIKLITNHENKLFKLKTNKKYGKLLTDVISSKDFDNIDEILKRYITKTYKEYLENKNIPIKFYTKYTELLNKTNNIWAYAKETNDYETYKPYLKSVIDMTKKYYKFIDKKSKNLYDVMLNKYEIGLTCNKIDPLFEELKKELIPLIKAIPKKEKKDVNIKYTKEELIDTAKYLLNYIGFNINKGCLGIYPHGFTERISKNDVRITFKQSTKPSEFVTTVIHEGGHGIFEQNINKDLYIFGNIGLNNLYGLHESQSRFYENILGRNRNFWIPIYNDISKKLHLDLSIDEFVDSLNTVEKSLIRTEADEVTYPLHIILRYEIERDLFNGKLKVDELPKVWNKKMKEYLNIEVKEDKDGLMQDVHWSEGSFGYFPSYLLGSIYDGMFLETIENKLGNIDDLLKDGHIKDITNYLIENIYQYGGAYSSLEIIKKLCNKELSVKPLINYYKNKYIK